MLINDLSIIELYKLAKTSGISFKTGPYNISLKTSISHVIEELYRNYNAAPLRLDPSIIHFDIQLATSEGLRRFFRRQTNFIVDGIKPFEPFPYEQSYPLLEWGINWCIATTSHNWLLLHSATVELDGNAIILPATPGSGKSTLCSGLVSRDWRLLSDEFGIVGNDPLSIIPLPRSIPLKNQSIDVIKQFAHNANIGITYPNTRKGDLAHFSPDKHALTSQHITAKPKWIIFPKYVPHSDTCLTSINKSTAFIRLSNNSFNYHALMEKGFNTLYELVNSTQCFSFEYSDLDDAVRELTHLARNKR